MSRFSRPKIVNKEYQKPDQLHSSSLKNVLMNEAPISLKDRQKSPVRLKTVGPSITIQKKEPKDGLPRQWHGQQSLLGSEPESDAVERASAASPVCSPAEQPLIVAYGGGTNSTAMLCGFRERGIRPSLILFADTGGELPHTYEHLRLMSDKCQEWFGLPIETVFKTYKGEFEGLEGECIRRQQLPSLAYGYKACSLKYKQEPQRKRIRQWMDEQCVKDVVQAVGFDFAEGHRATYVASNDLGKGRTARNWFPLIEWQWARKECVEAIRRHGLPQAGKSSCFFCPAMKLHEIIRLRDQMPEYYERAISLEKNVKVKGPKQGLAFGAKWSDIVKADDSQMKFIDLILGDPAHVPCGCYDG